MAVFDRVQKKDPSIRCAATIYAFQQYTDICDFLKEIQIQNAEIKGSTSPQKLKSPTKNIDCMEKCIVGEWFKN